MKILKRKTTFILLSIILCFGFSSCGNKEKTAFVSAEGVKHIILETSGHDVVVKETGANEVSISVGDYDGELFSQNGDILTIDIPMSDKIINLGSGDKIYLTIPTNSVSTLNIVSGVGGVDIESVDISEISVTADHGDIRISGLNGILTATAELGEIKTSLSLSENLEALNHGAGDSFEGAVGSSGSSNVIHLTTKAGDIEIK